MATQEQISEKTDKNNTMKRSIDQIDNHDEFNSKKLKTENVDGKGKISGEMESCDGSTKRPMSLAQQDDDHISNTNEVNWKIIKTDKKNEEKGNFKKYIGGINDLRLKIDKKDGYHLFEPSKPPEPAKEINASIYSHKPIKYKLIPIQGSVTDYSNIKPTMGVDDPRLRKSIGKVKDSMTGPFQFSCDIIKSVTADCSKMKSVVMK